MQAASVTFKATGRATIARNKAQPPEERSEEAMLGFGGVICANNAMVDISDDVQVSANTAYVGRQPHCSLSKPIQLHDAVESLQPTCLRGATYSCDLRVLLA
mgnify:FL=1